MDLLYTFKFFNSLILKKNSSNTNEKLDQLRYRHIYTLES